MFQIGLQRSAIHIQISEDRGDHSAAESRHLRPLSDNNFRYLKPLEYHPEGEDLKSLEAPSGGRRTWAIAVCRSSFRVIFPLGYTRGKTTSIESCEPARVLYNLPFVVTQVLSILNHLPAEDTRSIQL